jgi:hypothetical protein
MIQAAKLKLRMWGLFGRTHREDFLSILPRHSTGVELGVFKGEFSWHILDRVQPREFHLIDVWWKEFGEYFPDWGAYTDFGKLKTKDAWDQAKHTIAQFSTNSTIHVGEDLDILNSFPDHYFDWVYLDSSHAYDHTRKELDIICHKIKPDGMITGHDWQPSPAHIHHGVYKAVKEFCDGSQWKVFHLDRYTQWALKMR